jgi:hypothetical protein
MNKPLKAIGFGKKQFLETPAFFLKCDTKTLFFTHSLPTLFFSNVNR